jgi:hypothetical protein
MTGPVYWNHNTASHPWLLRLAADRLAGLETVDLSHADFSSFEPAGRRFDLITFVASLHHVPLQPARERARDLLRPKWLIAVVGLSVARTSVRSMDGDFHGAVDRLLAEQGLARRLGPVASHHLAAGAMLSASDLFLTVPESVGRVLADAFHLVAQPVPLDLPAVRLAATWARRNEEAPQHRWLRHALARLAQQVPKG